MSGTGKPAIILDDVNYVDWRVYAEAVMTISEFMEILDGSYVCPQGSANSAGVKKWTKKNSLARAKLVTLVSPPQYPHVRDPSAKVCWDTLERIHKARGFGTRQSLMRKFVSLRKDVDVTMEAFVANVRHEAHNLKEMGADITDQWVILVLTLGILDQFPSLVEALDNVDESLLTVDYVVQRMLNAAATRTEQDNSQHRESRAMGARYLQKTPVANDRCHRCGGVGHFKTVCPSPPNQSERGQARSAVQEEHDDVQFGRAGIAFGTADCDLQEIPRGHVEYSF